MAPKFKPPIKRKTEPDLQTGRQPRVGKKGKKNVKTVKEPEMRTEVNTDLTTERQSKVKTKSKTESETKSNLKPEDKSDVISEVKPNTNGNEFVFCVASGATTSVNVKKTIKMSKKFGVVDGKGLDDIEFEDQQVPMANLEEDKAKEDITVPEVEPRVNLNFRDIDWEDFVEDDEFFDPD